MGGQAGNDDADEHGAEQILDIIHIIRCRQLAVEATESGRERKGDRGVTKTETEVRKS